MLVENNRQLKGTEEQPRMALSPVSEMQVTPGQRGGGKGAPDLPNWVLAGLYVERHLDIGAHSQVNWVARTACPYYN